MKKISLKTYKYLDDWWSKLTIEQKKSIKEGYEKHKLDQISSSITWGIVLSLAVLVDETVDMVKLLKNIKKHNIKLRKELRYINLK